MYISDVWLHFMKSSYGKKTNGYLPAASKC